MLSRVTTQRLGIAVCQRLEHKRTPLINRNLGRLDKLISVEPTVPLLRDVIDPLSVLERMVAFGIVRVDLLPSMVASERPSESTGKSKAKCSTHVRSGV